MFARHGRGFVLATLLLGTPPAMAQSTAQPGVQTPSDEVSRLRQELDALRREYESRLAELERRLGSLEAGGPQARTAEPPPGQVPTEAPTPPGAAGAGGPSGPLPIYGNVSALSKIFNPDIAVIGDFLGAVGENAVDPPPALELHEAEASLQAIVDPYARADFFFAFSPEGVEIEEGYLTFPTLPGGLLMKAGKLRAAFGKVNTFHNHMLPWTDRPLVTTNLVGGEEGIADAGVSVSRLILNPWFFLEATGEVYQGNSELFASHERSDATYVGRLRGYQDLGESTNLDLGVSFARGENEEGPGFSTRLIGVDATFRYRPLRRAIYQRLLARTELVWSRREQIEDAASAFGFYAAADYQFARRWFAGGRFDYSERAFDASLSDKGGSLLLTFWPSEFNQVRGQYRRITYADGQTGNEFLFQFLFSIGAHGAHPF